MADLLLRRARLALEQVAGPDPVDILIRSGQIAALAPSPTVAESDIPVLDVAGRLVLPGLVEGHIHLDKALTRDRILNRSGTLAEAIRCNLTLSSSVSEEDIVERATATALWALRCGTTMLRTHVNVDPQIELRGLHALLRVRERLRSLLDIEIVALPNRLLGEQGRRGRELLAAALEEGADAIGGTPLVEEDQRGLIDEVFRLARRYGRPLDLHIDESESPADFVLPYLAERTLQEGYEGRVVAGHCCSLAAVDDATAARTIELVARARIAVATLPATNLYLQGRRDRQPIRRGITRVKELLAAGVTVFCGSDNIKDMFNPFGSPDLLQMAQLLGYVAQMGSPEEQRWLLASITRQAAAALGRSAGLSVGEPADLVVLDCQRREDILSDLPARLYVIKRGRIVWSTPGAGLDPLAQEAR
jgi:cytosine deaminase